MRFREGDERAPDDVAIEGRAERGEGGVIADRRLGRRFAIDVGRPHPERDRPATAADVVDDGVRRDPVEPAPERLVAEVPAVTAEGPLNAVAVISATVRSPTRRTTNPKTRVVVVRPALVTSIGDGLQGGDTQYPDHVIHPSVPYARRSAAQSVADRAGVWPRSTFCPSQWPIDWIR
jgi:hypothetical protein